MLTRNLVFALLFALPALAGAQGLRYGDFKPDVANDQEYIYDGQVYSIISHADDGWDAERVSFPGAYGLIEFSKAHNIPSIGIISSYGGGDQAFEQKDVTHVVDSSGGQHHLKFPNAREFYVSGGNLSYCLCEAIRDLARGTNGTTVTKPVIFNLVTDGVYDDNYQWPDDFGQAPHTQKFTLAEAITASAGDDAKLMRYLGTIFQVTDFRFCPMQTSGGHQDVTARVYTFPVYLNGNKLGSLGGTGREIQIVLKHSTELRPSLFLTGR